MDILDVILLAVVQGITEWLPVSSSGHLVLTQHFLGLSPPLIFDVLLHFGTAFVVFVVFWDDIKAILKAIAKGDFTSEEGKLALLILIGSIPTAFIGLFLNDFIESLFLNIQAVGGALLVTGVVLFLTKDRTGEREPSYRDGILIGLAQGAALVPGISRSGSTIGVGMLLGIERQKAARFSFLLMLPAVLGAGFLEAGDINSSEIGLDLMILGVLVSVIVGYISLQYLLRVITAGRFHLFAYYCWALGVLVLVFG
jgi:undecaprenyl-diphosphatase